MVWIILVLILAFGIYGKLSSASKRSPNDEEDLDDFDDSDDFYDHSEYDKQYLMKLQRAAKQLIDAAGRPDPETGYYNMPKWSVSGKSSNTHRKNTIEVRAVDEAHARAAGAASRSMVEPIHVEPSPIIHSSHCSELDLPLPRGTGKDDEEKLLQSVANHDTTPITEAFFKYLTAKKIPVSRFSGRNSAADALFNALDSYEKSVFYIYAVECSLNGTTPCDAFTSPGLPLYQSFAEAAARDPQISASVNGRNGSDFWRPNKNTAAYKYAFAFLVKNHGIPNRNSDENNVEHVSEGHAPSAKSDSMQSRCVRNGHRNATAFSFAKIIKLLLAGIGGFVVVLALILLPSLPSEDLFYGILGLTIGGTMLAFGLWRLK